MILVQLLLEGFSLCLGSYIGMRTQRTHVTSWASQQLQILPSDGTVLLLIYFILLQLLSKANPLNPLKSQQFQILPSDGTVSLRLILFSSYCGRDFIPAWDRTLVLQHREALYRAGGGPRTGKGKISQIQNLLDYIYIQSYWNCEILLLHVS